MIAIVDYNAGNLTSVAAAVRALHHEAVITSDPQQIRKASRIIFPGVGAAGAAMRNLAELGLLQPLRESIGRGIPFLGICLGYQVLFEHSAEDDTDCLGVLPGSVVRFPGNMQATDSDRALKIPQMGWNRAVFQYAHPVWANLPDGTEFYFVHSYYAKPGDGLTCAITDYGIDFASGAARDNLVAFQFHPEKSGHPGLKLLDNFCRWQP